MRTERGKDNDKGKKGQRTVEEALIRDAENNQRNTMKVDGVFVAIGYDPAVALAKWAGVELTEDGFIGHDDHHRTSVKGIYSAGDVEGGIKQIATAIGNEAEAALFIYEDMGNLKRKPIQEHPDIKIGLNEKSGYEESSEG